MAKYPKVTISGHILLLVNMEGISWVFNFGDFKNLLPSKTCNSVILHVCSI